MTTIPCWIISMNPEAPLAAALARELADAGITHQFVPAVDGRQGMPALQGAEHFDNRTAWLRHQKLLTPRQVGCYLAHYRTIARAWNEGLERVCILEDDVSIEPAFRETLDALSSLPSDIEMVRLMALRIRRRKAVMPLPGMNEHLLVRPERGWCGCQAYVINRAGMKKLLEHAARIFEPIDKLVDHFWEFDLRLYGVEPHVCYENPHQSSTRTPGLKPARAPWLLRLLAPLHKAAFSRSRHRYLKAHADEFYPAEMPAERMGRTKRMK
ncbi:glycosyltransferase family 25 protein [Perlucidibaca piscinae]|uniref:glycosyltransferase family 25 protein n=1 Tax=Perlucidibaca piscinae TaxID=392589 RepID=UPI0003B6356A|nr:glycosyltransferase family 25 protein [Perlucidibaca piscinae]